MDTRELVERCKRREGQAMGLLYSAYAAKLERVCRKYIKDEADVQDIVHDSFVIIFTSIDRLKDPSKLESWMCTIARNLSLKHLQQPIATGVDDPNSNDGPFEQSPDTLVSTRTRHYMPLTFGLTFGTRLSSCWTIEAGLRYTLLRTDVATTTSLSDNSLPPTRVTTTQSQHYIGLPIRLTYSLFRTSSFALYASGGTTLDLPLDLSGAALWSVYFGAGIQYRLTPAISLYAEPGCNCFLNSGHGANAVRTDRPFEFTLPVGLRFTW